MNRTPCVYYRFTVEEERSSRDANGHSSTHWHKVIDDKRSIDVAVADATGEAQVLLDEAEIVLRDAERTHSDLFTDPPARLKRLLQERYNRSTKGWFFNKTMRFTEEVLEEGVQVVVVGEVEIERRTPILCRGTTPLVVSDRSEKGLGGHYRSRSRMCWIIAIVLLVFFALMAGCAGSLSWTFYRALDNFPTLPVPDPPKTNQAEVNRALVELRSPDVSARLRAVEALSRQPVDAARRAEVAGALLPLLQDGDQRITTTALAALKVWGGPECVPALEQVVRRGNLMEMPRVIDALSSIKDEKSADVLCEVLTGTRFRAAAGVALMRMGPVAEKSVLKLLQHRDFVIRLEALRLLKEIGTKESLPAVKNAISDGHVSVSRAAREAFESITRSGR